MASAREGVEAIMSGSAEPGAGLARIAELVRIYADLPLGTVGASVIAVAERLRMRPAITLRGLPTPLLGEP
jgi:hypothetical protein